MIIFIRPIPLIEKINTAQLEETITEVCEKCGVETDNIYLELSDTPKTIEILVKNTGSDEMIERKMMKDELKRRKLVPMDAIVAEISDMIFALMCNRCSNME